MKAAVSLGIERDPDFFALSAARGRSRTLIAETDSGAVGCVSLSRRPAWVGGDRSEVACIADLKVAPTSRARGLGARLVDAILEYVAEAPPLPLVATIAAGNRAADVLAARSERTVGPTDARDMTCLQLLGTPRLLDEGLEINRATDEDGAELAELFDAFYRPRQFAPVFGHGGMREILDRSPGLSLRDHLVARRRGRIVSAVAMWDQSAFKRVRVVGITPWLRFAFWALRIASRIFAVPSPPRRGQFLRLCFLRHPAHAPGEELALATLLRAATRQATAAGQHFAVLTVPLGDPLARCASGIPRLVYRYRLLVGATAPRSSPISPTPCHVFDDAALA